MPLNHAAHDPDDCPRQLCRTTHKMSGPFILIEYGVPHVVDKLPEYQPNRLAVMDESWKRCHAFDAQSEYRQDAHNIPSFGWLAKLLARTVYNPSENIDCEWTVCGQYDPKRIVTLVNDGLKHDDDLIQQWFEARQIRKLLKNADSFDKMILAVRCICGEHEINDEAKQYAHAVL